MIDIRNGLVLIYVIMGYTLSIILLLNSYSGFILFGSVFLLTHTLTWSAYMHHELAHQSVFDNRIWNIRFGCIMDWINGACYWSFDELRKQHINHHIYKVDFDFTSEFLKYWEGNDLFKYSLLICEYFYFPLHSYIFQWRSVLSPWWKEERKSSRFRSISVFIIRTIYFSLLYYVGGLLMILYYVFAYSISIQITRFTDAFSHSYETVPVGTQKKHLSKSYDMLHTYSIVWETDENTSAFVRLCAQLTHIIFFLNFNFHNQHHYATQKSWFQLGSSFEFDNELMTIQEKDNSRKVDEKNKDEYIMNNQPNGDLTVSDNGINSLADLKKNTFTIPLFVALKYFHIHRVNRIFGKSMPPVLDPITKRLSLESCFGVTDASVLVLEV